MPPAIQIGGAGNLAFTNTKNDNMAMAGSKGTLASQAMNMLGVTDTSCDGSMAPACPGAVYPSIRRLRQP